ncbi:MAG: SRPBCC family protein [Bacteroidetes bacterium]|nr:SRPBCC family protein [Bacteroidota bacterium]
MKILRFLLILILILAAGYLVLCAVSDKELKVERTTMISAPKAVVFEQMVKFKNWDNWSPWKEQDSTITSDITGTDGEKGSVYHYVGKNSGEGKSINEGVSDGEMKYTMEFIKPFKSVADGYYKAAEEGGQTKASWYFHQEIGFFMRGFAALMIKPMLEKSFERGLELMKIYCEAHKEAAPAANNSMTITETDYAAHIYAGVRANVKWADMHKFFGDAYALVGKEAGQSIAGPASGLYWTWDTTKMEANMMACFPVKDEKPVKGATIEKVAAGKAYMMHYVGPYGGFMAAHNAMHAKLVADKKEHRLVIEEYIKTADNETDSNKYETNIYYLLK